MRARRRRFRLWHILPVLALLGLAVAAFLHFRPVRMVGAVVATVDDVPVTRDDIAAEARAVGVSPDRIDPATSQALLKQVIDRRLLVAAARRQGIDANPIYQADRARADEMRLAGTIARRFSQRPEPITDAEARRYAAANPAMFAGRRTFVVDAITTRIDGLTEESLTALTSMTGAVSLLQSLNRPFQRATRRQDSGTLPPPLLKRLDALKPDALFVLPNRQEVLIGTIVERIPNPLPAVDQLAAARVAAGQERTQITVDKAIAALRTSARINYAK